MLENIDQLILTVAKIFSLSDKITLANAPAQVSQYVHSTSLFADIKTIASEISLALSIVFVAVIVYIIIARRWAAQPPANSESPTEIVDAAPAPASGVLRQRWNEVLKHIDSNRENDWKTAVMEADKLVDTALQQGGFSGETFGDRLANIQPGTLLSLDGLWWAHRVRNRVAHEVDYFLRYTEARQAISYYEATLSELQMI